MSDSTLTGNPVLDWEEVPPFDRIKTEHFIPAFDILFDEAAVALQEIEALEPASYAELIDPLERLIDRLMRSWGILSHLNSVKNSPELRTVYETIQPQFIEFNNKLQQSEPIYHSFLQIKASAGWEDLDEGQRRIVDQSLKNAELSGVGLSGEAKDKFNALSQSLGKLTTKFSNNVLDATKAFKYTVESKDELDGVPDSYLALSSQTAKREGFENSTPEDGPWMITLDMPSYGPIQKFAHDRNLRKKIYEAYFRRASMGDTNNEPLTKEIVGIRQEMAELLGFENYAELSLSRKMAGNIEAVDDLHSKLLSASKPAATRDLKEIEALAQKEDGSIYTEIEPWDELYWAEKLRESRFDFNEEALREYFPFEQVLSGMFDLVTKLFDIVVIPADGEVPVWHPDVRYFRVQNNQQEDIAHLYLDPFSRPQEKRGGAWAFPAVNRSNTLTPAGKEIRLPVAYMSCNQSPPVGDRPSLMTLREVETLFHEFGHDLQHMLTTVNHTLCAGLAMIEWDAIEIASQFMENWIYHKPTLKKLSGHFQTGEPLSDEIMDKIIDARSFRAGYTLTRQIYFGMFDMELHARYGEASKESILEVQNRMASKTLALVPPKDNYFYLQFGHIFAGGYAAGYYSYKWSEVLCADAFAAFLEAGLDNEKQVKEVGHRYRDTILAKGGSQAPMDVFVAFRGREPSIEPLLIQERLI